MYYIVVAILTGLYANCFSYFNPEEPTLMLWVYFFFWGCLGTVLRAMLEARRTRKLFK